MDHAESHAPARTPAERRRRAEPYVFFFGTLGAVLIAIILIIVTSHQQVGPDTAQRPGPTVAPQGH